MTPFEQMFHVMKKPWVLLLYVTLTVLVYQYADKFIASYFQHYDLRTYGHALHFITALGKSKFYILLFSLLALYFRYIKKNALNEHRTWFLLACVLLANLMGLALKITLGRSRPDLFFDGGMFGFYWFKLDNLYWSFPSGHSITIAALASGLSILFPRYFYVYFGMALLVIMTRVFLYFHFLSDVMVGFYLSVLMVGYFLEGLKKRHCLLGVVG